MNEQSSSSPHLDEDACLDLLHGLEPPEKREASLQHLAACPSCAQRFQLMFSERESLRAQEGEALRGDEAAPESTLWARLRASLRRPRLQLAMGLAAAVAVVIVTLLPRQAPEPEASLLYWLPSSTADLRLRTSDGTALNEDLAAGLEAYGNRDLDRATRLLERAEVGGHYETIRKIYLGSTLAWSGKHAEAAALLGNLSTRTLPDPWRSEARWTLFVALRGCGRNARADSLLALLNRESGEIGRRAHEQLE